MIDKSATFFEGFAKDLGLSIKIPRPGRTIRRVSAATNSVVGVSLVIAGIAVSSKVLIGIGALGLAGAAILAVDKDRGDI